MPFTTQLTAGNKEIPINPIDGYVGTIETTKVLLTVAAVVDPALDVQILRVCVDQEKKVEIKPGEKTLEPNHLLFTQEVRIRFKGDQYYTWDPQNSIRLLVIDGNRLEVHQFALVCQGKSEFFVTHQLQYEFHCFRGKIGLVHVPEWPELALALNHVLDPKKLPPLETQDQQEKPITARVLWCNLAAGKAAVQISSLPDQKGRQTATLNINIVPPRPRLRLLRPGELIIAEKIIRLPSRRPDSFKWEVTKVAFPPG